MRTKAWQCVAGAALAIGTLTAAQAADPGPAMVDRSNIVQPHSDQRQSGSGARHGDQTIYLLAGTGLLAFGGIVLVGGVVGLGGMRIPGGVAMTVGRTRLWARSMRTVGAHRAG